MINILVISRFAPYDGVCHAGGKTHNYYIKQIAKDGRYRINIVSFCDKKEKNKVDLEEYGITDSMIYIDDDLKHKIIRRIPDLVPLVFEPQNGYELLGQRMRKMVLEKLRCLRNSGYIPDVIILEWTQIVMVASDIHRIYPDAKLCASEHDVTFLSYQRKVDYAEGTIKKRIRQRQFIGMRYKELKELSECSLIYTQSKKDTDLLRLNNVEASKLFTISPYYEDYGDVVYTGRSNNIIFFGAMDRKENYMSALWFVKNVLKKIEDKNIKFIIIGNKPDKCLYKYEGDRVVITGFISNEKLKDYFSSCLCFVAPLVIGGGIKVKVLEAFSAGVPVLTNRIGIEGIPAVDKESYLHCETSDDYVNAILGLTDKRKIQIGYRGKQVVEKHFSLGDSAMLLKNRIAELI